MNLSGTKILVIGDGHSSLHETSVVNALKKMGYEVESFYWHLYFKSNNLLGKIFKKLSNRFIVGPIICRLNRDLVSQALLFMPNLIFVYRGTHITKRTILSLRKDLPNCYIFGYNNDDPFSAGHIFGLWRHYLQCLTLYDATFAYRRHNIYDLEKAGARRVELLRSWFIPEINRPVKLSSAEKSIYGCDVVFIGHYENDGRLECLVSVVEAGYSLKIYGPPYEWNKRLLRSSKLKNLAPVRLVWDHEYNKALCGAKIALCFLSKLNRDTYTRRCFEIPASGTLLMSELSSDLASMYVDGEEAVFFASRQDLAEKLDRYLRDETLRKNVALNGYRRCLTDNHDIYSRMSQLMERFQKIRCEKNR